jgi:glycosyltransferase involved in cell wall biosynthesis
VSQEFRLLLWSPSGAGTHYSGPGMSMYRMLASHLPQSWSVTLVHGNPLQQHYPLFEKQIFLGPVAPLSPWRQLRFLAAARLLLSQRSSQFDVFLGIDTYESTVRPAYWAQQLGLNAVVRPASFMSGIGKSRGLSSLLGMAQRRQAMLQQLSGMIAISEAIRNSLLKIGCDRSRIHYIPNGVDITRFSPTSSTERQELRDRIGWPKNRFILAFVGGLSARKRPEWIVEALSLLQQAGHDTIAAFVGPERERGCLARLESQARHYGVYGRILWHKQTDSIEDIYRASNVFCLPSSREGMSNALLEAVSCGLPSLATQVSGSEEIICHGRNGFFVSSPQELAYYVGKLVNDRELYERMAICARSDAVERFDALRMWNSYADILTSRWRQM